MAICFPMPAFSVRNAKHASTSAAPGRTSTPTPTERGQSTVELALTVPLLVLLLVGLVEVVFFARSFMVLLAATREGSRLGARGAANFDDNEIATLVEQQLAADGIGLGRGLLDVIVIRADVGPGRAINNYSAASIHNGGQPVYLTRARMLSRLQPTDPSSRLIAIELHYSYRPALGFPLISQLFRNPMQLHPYSIMRMLQ